jgi:hypothetical protein
VGGFSSVFEFVAHLGYGEDEFMFFILWNTDATVVACPVEYETIEK